MKTVAFCEQDQKCQKVLQKNWPNVPVFNDVKNLCTKSYREETIWKHLEDKIDVICGGFPCQDVSVAGNQKGLIDEETNKKTRSGLWFEFKRIIKEIKPRYAIIENVANLRSEGLATVIKDLWSIGYDCEWHIISARSVGAPHLRERVWIIAYANDSGRRKHLRRKSESSEISSSELRSSGHSGKESSNPNNIRLWKPFASEEEKSEWWAKATSCFSHWKEAESIVCGMDDGLSRGVDRSRRVRIKQLGNSVVPQIPELIGRHLMSLE